MTSPYDAALQDPEYLLFLAQQRAAAGRRQANYNAEVTDLEGQYGAQNREIERELPKQLQRGTENSAGRGMLHSGGQLEDQGEIRGSAAGLLSKIAGNKGRDLSGLLRSLTDAQAGDSSDQQNSLASAARRASERAMNAPITPGGDAGNRSGAVETAAAPMEQQPVYMPPTNDPLTGRPSGDAQASDVTLQGIEFGGGGWQPPTSPIQSGDNQTTLPQIQAANSPTNATLTVNGTRVTTNAAGIINTRGPYYGKYPSQVGAR